jgi:RimJ/RimL family protein N-acetyltransferase
MNSIGTQNGLVDLATRNALPAVITTQRLVLRQPNHDDVAEMARLANNKAIFQVLARLPHPYAETDARFFIDKVATGDTERAYSITWRDGPHKGSYLGTVSFHLQPGKAPELGYWLGQPHWGQGLMSEAVSALLATARATGRYRKIRASALETNAGSLNVLEKHGFVRVGSHLDDKGHNLGKTIIELLLEERP